MVDGYLDQVIPLLSDPYDIVKQELAATLVAVRERRVAVALIESYAQLNVFVMGGTESRLLRDQTKSVFEEVLAIVTGVKLDPNWTHEQKVRAFTAAIQRLPQ